MKNTRSNIVEKTVSNQSAFHYRVGPLNPTMVNLYFRHTKEAGITKRVTSVRRGAFKISWKVPKFNANAISYTRPSNYY